jgi:hypothetical protein
MACFWKEGQGIIWDAWVKAIYVGNETYFAHSVKRRRMSNTLGYGIENFINGLYISILALLQ